MDPSQSFSKHEDTPPEFYYVPPCPWLWLFSKISRERALVRELQKHVKAVTMDIAAIELDNIRSGS
jgi:hypothetical protein